MVKKLVFMVFLLIVYAVFAASPAGAKMVLKYGHTGALNQARHLGALAFARYVTEKTGGEIEVQVFPRGQLGGERAMVEQVQVGTLQMTTISAGVLANFVSEVGVIELPFAYPDRETAYRVLDDKEVGEGLRKYCEPKGFVFIGYTEDEFRDLTNWKGPVTRPEDLKGLRIRVLKGPLSMDTFRTLGATPVSLPMEEVYAALQKRTIDGQDNPLYTSVRMRFTEVNPYVTMTDHVLTECPVILNKKFWDGLSARHKHILREGAAIQTGVNREGALKARMEALEKAKAANVTITVLNPQDRESFRKSVKPVYDRYRDVFGPEWYDFFMKKIEYYRR